MRGVIIVMGTVRGSSMIVYQTHTRVDRILLEIHLNNRCLYELRGDGTFNSDEKSTMSHETLLMVRQYSGSS